MSKTLRVCHFSTVHVGNDIRILIKECRTLAAAGMETHYVFAGDKDLTDPLVQLHRVEKGTGRLRRMLLIAWRVYKKARSLDADIYHFHDPELLPHGLLLKLQGKMVIYDVHEDRPSQIRSKYWVPPIIREPLAWIFEPFENFCARRFDGMIGATPAIADRFRRMSSLCENINNYPIKHELIAETADWANKERAVCYVGDFTAIRGIAEMLNAMAKTDVKLFLAGEFQSVALRTSVAGLMEAADVRELGFINRNQMKEVFAKSVAGLVIFHPVPNHVNAQPNKLFEYMSAGIPVIASDFPLWKEIIEANGCGICVDPFDIAGIASAITYLADHPDEAERMGINGQKAVADKYNWEREETKLLQYYRSVSANQ